MDISSASVTVPSFICLAIIAVCVLVVLIAPPRYIRSSFLVILVTIIGYMAVLAITIVGSPHSGSASQDDEVTNTEGDTSGTESAVGGSE